MSNPLAAFTPAELRKLRSFKDPYGIQRFLDDTPYHLQDTAWSPRVVLREQALPEITRLLSRRCQARPAVGPTDRRAAR